MRNIIIIIIIKLNSTRDFIFRRDSFNKRHGRIGKHWNNKQDLY